MRYLLIVPLTFLLISSCNNVNKRVIIYNNLEKDLALFQDKKNDLNDIQNEFLRYLGTYNQNPEIKTFVNSLTESDYTYTRAFSELNGFNNELMQFKEEKEILFNTIDDTCNVIQHEINMQKHLRDSINSFVKPDISIVRKTIWDYYWTVIEIDSRIYNYSHSTINHLSFDYIVRKNDSVVFKIPCEVDLPFIDRLIQHFIFDDELHAKIYQNLESVGLPFYSADYQVKKIVFANGNTLVIDEKFYSDENLIDKQYISPSKLTGECPYISDGAYLTNRIQQLRSQVDAYINKTSLVMAPFLKWYLDL